MVAQFSTPNLPPCLKVGFLPPAGMEQEVVWVSLEEAEPIPDISWSIRVLQPPPEQEHAQYVGLDFEAILIQPSNPPDKTQVPMVVMPHGDPIHPLSLPGCYSQPCFARWALQLY